MCGRSDTRYSPVRRSPSYLASQIHAAPRLACVKPVASVHPEPGSNSSSYFILFFSFFLHAAGAQAPDRIPGYPRAATKKQTAAQMDTASLSSSYGIISKIFANRFVPESECKSTDFYNNYQILNTLFSKEKDDDMASMVHNLFSNSIFRSIKKNHARKGRKRLPMYGKAWKTTGASATQR